MPKVADLPRVRQTLGKMFASDVTPEMSQLLQMDVPEGDEKFHSLVDQKIADEILPGLRRSTVALDRTNAESAARDKAIEAGIDPRTGETFHEQAVRDLWAQSHTGHILGLP